MVFYRTINRMNLVKPLFDLGKKEEKSFNLVGLNLTADLFSKYFAGSCWSLLTTGVNVQCNKTFTSVAIHTYTFVN